VKGTTDDAKVPVEELGIQSETQIRLPPLFSQRTYTKGDRGLRPAGPCIGVYPAIETFIRKPKKKVHGTITRVYEKKKNRDV
jgi:hypothetical protein